MDADGADDGAGGRAVAMIRRPTLTEWFMALQVEAIRREHVHNPGLIRLDLTPLREAWARRRARDPAAPERPPWTAIVVRAVGRLMAEAPNLNRMLFHTPIGRRVVDFPYVTVNVPVRLRATGYLAACIVQDADRRSLHAIAAELAAFRDTPQARLPIGRHFVDGRNTWWKRLQLRVLHWLAFRLPWMYLRRRGGGVSVSSLLNNRQEAHIQAIAWGPTALTFAPTGMIEEGGRLWLEVGVGVDHAVLTGDEAWQGVAKLQGILGGLAGELETA